MEVFFTQNRQEIGLVEVSVVIYHMCLLCALCEINTIGRPSNSCLCCHRVTVLLNLAALHMATKQCQLAIQSCTQALSLDPKSCKALLQRAKAHLKMHNYQV